jgi:hypothetical protein
MPRPITKGPKVQLRLPLHLHNFVEARAEAHQEPINSYLARNITNLLQREYEKVNGAPEAVRPQPAPPRNRPRARRPPWEDNK